MYQAGLPTRTSLSTSTQTKGAIGTVLWTNTVQPPAGNITVEFVGADATAGVFVEYYEETMQFVGYSLATGKQIWGPVGDQVASCFLLEWRQPWPGRWLTGNSTVAIGYGGIIYCYDMTNWKSIVDIW